MIPKNRTVRRALPLASLAVAAGMLAGCASGPDGEPPVPNAEPTTPLLTTPHAATVIELGDGGVQMCVGGIAMSYPPQCGGPALVDWDWAQWRGSYAEAGDVRWGEFALTGRYDAQAFTFTPEVVEPWHDDMPVADAPAGPDFSTPCPEPAGGWRVLDSKRTTDATMNETFERASRLDGYATSWVDRSRVRTAGPDATPEEQLAESATHPELTIVNVRVVGDVEAATADLRRVWGGMLCVSAAERTQSELQTIADEIMADEPRGILAIGVDGTSGIVTVEVIHDDGSLQERMEDEYGVGVVVVTSALRPASSE